MKWEAVSTGDDYGLVDIAKKIKNYKGSTMYATADFYSDRKQTVEIRLPGLGLSGIFQYEYSFSNQ